jgi:hypothetical protein
MRASWGKDELESAQSAALEVQRLGARRYPAQTADAEHNLSQCCQYQAGTSDGTRDPCAARLHLHWKDRDVVR